MKILLYILLFSTFAKAACCCYPGASCAQVNAAVASSVENVILNMQENDKEHYAKKVDELSQYLERINLIEKEIEKIETRLLATEKTEAFYLLKKASLLQKIGEIDDLLTLASLTLGKAEISEVELKLIENNLVNTTNATGVQ